MVWGQGWWGAGGVDSGERGKDKGFVIYLWVSRQALMGFLGARVHGFDWAFPHDFATSWLIRKLTPLACQSRLLMYNLNFFISG